MLGFHGCDEAVRNEIINNPNFIKKSQESFDWLGHGFYLWENNFERALQWAKDKKRRKALKTPSTLGVVYQLNNCLDFTDSAFTKIIGEYYVAMKDDFSLIGKQLPQNKNLPKDQYHDLILRELDCSVIEYLHQKVSEEIEFDIKTKRFSNLQNFDTVRGVFTEGGPAFEGAGIQTKNHIQVCIRNLNCIKGFFIPRQEVKFP
jgi:hypothetical protein